MKQIKIKHNFRRTSDGEKISELIVTEYSWNNIPHNHVAVMTYTYTRDNSSQIWAFAYVTTATIPSRLTQKEFDIYSGMRGVG